MNDDLQKQYEVLEAEKATLSTDDKFRLTVIEQEQAKIKAQLDEQDRLQRQAEEVATVSLPQDYDALWGVEGANAEITALLQQVKEYDFAISNDELATASQAWAEERAALAGQVADLQAANGKLTADKEAAEAQAKQDRNDMRTAQEQLVEAELKRDNAVKFMEEAQAEAEQARADRDKAVAEVSGLKGQIDELEAQVAQYKKKAGAGFGGGLKLTSTIKAESDEEKQAKAERERVEQLNRSLQRFSVTPLPLPPSIGTFNPPAAYVEAAASTEETEPAATDERFYQAETAELADGLDAEHMGDEAERATAEGSTLEAKVAALAERIAAVEAFVGL
ncbi:hypothetical protein [Cohnella sp. JJ-181]|uniref:hypothetical protein n=1 Tax=Cohnella rhizoplanae TaxID=2974897 RepID=UPI0022FF990E|nr:hypothetical protein [Cohnella sp. JJ-181]CAI6073335.1 hypothetical protein COHCIP112018_02381 [Cohnella sp. JJ-181]